MKKLVLSLLLVGACSNSNDAGPAVAVDPAALYSQNCARCHGPDGRGDPEMKKTMPTIRDFSDPMFRARNADEVAQVIMAGRTSPSGWPEVLPEPRDADLMVDEGDTVAHWVAAYREQVEASHAVVDSMELDDPCARDDIIECNVRYVLFHMIQETARHVGHADIIRETLDGSRGI